MATGTEAAAAAGWITSKIVPALAGLFGGLSLAAFWTPEKLREKGKTAAVFIAGGVSVGVAFTFTGMAAAYLGIDPGELDKVIAVAYGLGFGSMAILNWVAKFIERRENMDILQVADEVSSRRKSPAARAPRKAAAKKATSGRGKK